MALTQLYFVTMDNAPVDAVEQVDMACRAGIGMIQLRMKEASDEEFRRVATMAKEICDKWDCRLIINDRVAIAAAVDAHGVHVGLEDLPVREARRLLGPGKIVGATANMLEDIREHCAAGADYVGLGPYRHTTTKKKLSPTLGLEGYRRIMPALAKEAIAVPIFAIGGIRSGDVGGLLDAGVFGVAFSGMLLQAPNRTGFVKELKKVMLC
jgi:thiamine-phosphate pyrophosphorylase